MRYTHSATEMAYLDALENLIKSLKMSEQDAATFRFADEARNGLVSSIPTLRIQLGIPECH